MSACLAFRHFLIPAMPCLQCRKNRIDQCTCPAGGQEGRGKKKAAALIIGPHSKCPWEQQTWNGVWLVWQATTAWPLVGATMASQPLSRTQQSFARAAPLQGCTARLSEVQAST